MQARASVKDVARQSPSCSWVQLSNGTFCYFYSFKSKAQQMQFPSSRSS